MSPKHSESWSPIYTGFALFDKTLDADKASTSSNLTVTASGSTTFKSPVGGIKALTSLTTDAAGSTQIDGGAVTTTADQMYHDTVTLKQDTTLTGVNASMFNSVTGRIAICMGLLSR